MSMHDIMRRYCEGEGGAFQELYEALGPRVLAHLRCLVHERATAEDLLQQTFLKVHQARGAYVRGADPVPWIQAIAHRCGLDELRRQRRSRLQLQAGEAPLEPVADFLSSTVGSEAWNSRDLKSRPH